jgi:hypothetical protein
MNLETARELFSYICGQSRSFVADGVLLPLDQRCLGLYVGALLTALWLLGSGIWRRGLPTRGVFGVNVALLFAAMLGGLHVIDPGPLWRFAFGLWTGHVATLWLSGAAVQFWHLSRPGAAAELRWRTTQIAQALAFPAGLAGLAAALPLLLPLGWRFWTAAAGLGVAVLAGTILAAVLVMAHFAWRAWCSIPPLKNSDLA